MAYEKPGFAITLVAGATLASCQYKFAKISADDTCVMATDLVDIPVGIIQNNPVSGLAAEVMVSGISKLLVGAGGALAYGEFVGCDAEGCGVTVDPDGTSEYYYVGRVLQGAAANCIATVLINCATPVLTAGS